MLNRQSLNGTWGLTYAEGAHLFNPNYYTAETLEGRPLIEAQVPAPIHEVLMKAGLLADINVGMNSLAARWVEEMFWIYRRSFQAPKVVAGTRVWLVFERLEFDAVVFINGKEIGRHANAHRPARFKINDHIRPGENVLAVKLSCGFHSAADKPSKNYAVGEIGLLTKRHWHRRPQYQSGWDWNARLSNVGILGDVHLEWRKEARLDQVAVFAEVSADLSKATVRVRAMLDRALGDKSRPKLRVRIPEAGLETTVTVPPRPEKGEDRCEVTLTIEKPKLWWPVGHGGQFRYTVETTLGASQSAQSVTRQLGIRRVEIDQSPHPKEGQYFILKVNNRPIFCKGGNYVPADMLYSTVDAVRNRELVELALGANFNMLRIWGGGHYADHGLLDACDEAGMMVWHDFAFACAKYPGTDPEFTREVQAEVKYIVRELAHHGSLVVWSGNNEIELGDWLWGYDKSDPTHPHYALFHKDIAVIAKNEDPATFYWPSSPYSPDLTSPYSPIVGDQHPWGVSLSDPGPSEFWGYRSYVDRFPNEGGVLGATSPATLRQFLPAEERRLFSPSWEHHDNPFSGMARQHGALGRTYQTVQAWTGCDPRKMNWEDYAFASALLQAEGLGEYIHNFRRRMFSSASAIFWMYNDSWPVTHGWTIVDYYRRLKLAYHPVRRAFQPVTVVVAEEDGEVLIFGLNETRKPFRGTLRSGLFRLDGGKAPSRSKAVNLPPNASTILERWKRADWNKLGLNRSGAFAVLSDRKGVVAQHRLFVERFKDLAFQLPKIQMRLEGQTLTLRSEVFVWGVCLDVDGEAKLSDNCFDLLPGQEYTVRWPKELGEPNIVRVGSRDAVQGKVEIRNSKSEKRKLETRNSKLEIRKREEISPSSFAFGRGR